MTVPTFDNLIIPALDALRQLGGSGSVSEIDDRVAEIMHLTEADIKQVHRAGRTALAYRLAWARNYLKRFGLVENSSRGIWSLTDKGRRAAGVDKNEIVKFVHAADRGKRLAANELGNAEVDEPAWKEQLLQQLLKLSPQGFEKLCQRILRESGFVRVEVTGRSGDGGIDGKGIMRMGGLLSFHVVFQCKRYSGSVTPSMIRDFRGAIDGRADKGLFITTGAFTRDATHEATRDGATPIDLVNGEELAEKMKELGLGVTIKTKTEEVIEIDAPWFKSF